VSAKPADNKSASTRRDTAAGDTAAGDRAAGDRAAGDRGALAKSSGPKVEDVALVCGVSDDGQGVDIIRKRGERIETGTVRRLEPGKAIYGEVVRLKPREHAPLVCDVEVELAAPSSSVSPASSGPAQVATESYRKNWDAVYGRSKKPGSLLN
jgi:hypothetical protein